MDFETDPSKRLCVTDNLSPDNILSLLDQTFSVIESNDYNVHCK